MKKRITSVILFLLIVFSCISCNQKKESENPKNTENEIMPHWSRTLLNDPIRTKEGELTLKEVQRLITVMLPAAYEVSDIFWCLNAELEVDENGKWTRYEKDEEYILVDRSQYKTINNLKNFAEEVFIKELCEKSFYKEFSDDPPMYIEDNGNLYFIDRRAQVFPASMQNWLTDTAEIISQSENTICVEMKSLFEGFEDYGYVEYYKGWLVFKNVEGKWYLNSPVVNFGGEEGINSIIKYKFVETKDIVTMFDE